MAASAASRASALGGPRSIPSRRASTPPSSAARRGLSSRASMASAWGQQGVGWQGEARKWMRRPRLCTGEPPHLCQRGRACRASCLPPSGPQTSPHQPPTQPTCTASVARPGSGAASASASASRQPASSRYRRLAAHVASAAAARTRLDRASSGGAAAPGRPSRASRSAATSAYTSAPRLSRISSAAGSPASAACSRKASSAARFSGRRLCASLNTALRVGQGARGGCEGMVSAGQSVRGRSSTAQPNLGAERPLGHTNQHQPGGSPAHPTTHRLTGEMARTSTGLPVSVCVGRGGGEGAAKHARQASAEEGPPSTRRLGCLRVKSCGRGSGPVREEVRGGTR